MNFDAASTAGIGPGTTFSWTHTCAGANAKLFVAVFRSHPVTVTVTYNGVALTQLAVRDTQNGSHIELWELVNPAAGANTVTVTTSGGSFTQGLAASYNGAVQSSSSVAQGGTTGATSSTGAITAASASWLVGFFASPGGATTAGAGTVKRQAGGNCDLYDSNGDVTGAGSLIATGSSGNWDWIVAAAPDIPQTFPVINNPIGM